MVNFAESCSKLVKSGVCKGDCCGPVPMKRILLLDNMDKKQADFKLFDFGPEYEEVFPLTDGLYCLFLDRGDYHCHVYEDRPGVCKLFGTDDDVPALRCPHMDCKGIRRKE